MNPVNRQYLEDNMQHLINARADFFKNLGSDIRENFERIMSEEFRPGYRMGQGCEKCVLEMVKILDIHYRQWKDAQPVLPSFMEIEAGQEHITVAANFPSHKKKK